MCYSIPCGHSPVLAVQCCGHLPVGWLDAPQLWFVTTWVGLVVRLPLFYRTPVPLPTSLHTPHTLHTGRPTYATTPFPTLSHHHTFIAFGVRIYRVPPARALPAFTPLAAPRAALHIYIPRCTHTSRCTHTFARYPYPTVTTYYYYYDNKVLMARSFLLSKAARRTARAPVSISQVCRMVRIR